MPDSTPAMIFESVVENAHTEFAKAVSETLGGLPILASKRKRDIELV